MSSTNEKENNPIVSGYGPITDKMVRNVNELIGLKLPQLFSKWVVGENSDMGKPLKYIFLVCPHNWRNFTSGLAALLSFNLERSDNILKDFFSPPEFFPKGLVAFGEDGGGDFICFDYRADPTTDDPPVVYWAHEFDEGKDVIPLAPNFEAFLGMLMSEEEAEAALAKANGKA